MPDIAQRSRIFRPQELPVIDRGGGCRTIPLVTAARGGTTFLNGTTRFDPGASIAHHTHNVPESVVVIVGRAIVDIDGERSELDTFDTTFVPANVPHHFENASDSEPMAILWTYGSLDTTRTRVETGIRERIDAEQQSVLGEPETRPVLEVVTLVAAPGKEADLEAAVARAMPLFQASEGSRALSLERSVDNPGTYRMTIQWETVEHHTEGFRTSPAFGQWRELIMDTLAQPPTAEHFAQVYTGF